MKFPVLWLLLFCCCSCVDRRLLIDTEPQGARVFMDREDLGKTPIDMAFEYGGEREFLILHETEKTKYKPLRVVQNTEKFFIDVFPFDVLTQIQPFHVSDEHRFFFKLEKSDAVALVEADEDSYVKGLINRAETMRDRARNAQELGDPATPPLLDPVQKPDETTPKQQPSARPASRPSSRKTDG